MSTSSFQSYMTGGLLLLVIGVLLIAWTLWRIVDRERQMEVQAVKGIGHELRVNLHRFLLEIAEISEGSLKRAQDVLPIGHFQLDSLLSRPTERDRQPLTVIRANYDELRARKTEVREMVAASAGTEPALDAAMNAVIDGLASLYLWEIHNGKAPHKAPSVRSWDVRDWMKGHNFFNTALPGRHLRDDVVDRLRTYGMVLTPKPLTHTASEFYAMQYDRKADPHAPFWKRSFRTEEADTEETSDPEAEPSPIFETPTERTVA